MATPKYYKFNDVEVKEISGYLTGNGAQALQYIARSTRLDGENKGETITDSINDLIKARDFIDWEIKRLTHV